MTRSRPLMVASWPSTSPATPVPTRWPGSLATSPQPPPTPLAPPPTPLAPPPTLLAPPPTLLAPPPTLLAPPPTLLAPPPTPIPLPPIPPPIPKRGDNVPDLDPSAIVHRPLPAGFPEEHPRPPVVAESGDPFAALRVLEAVAQMERGRPVRIDDLVDRLNAAHLDWLFTRRVVVDVLVALQANWMTDYRNASGIVLDDGERGPVVTLEDTSRVNPWIVQQAQREVRACQEALDAFARRDDPFASG